jgi:hypothetical protein
MDLDLSDKDEATLKQMVSFSLSVAKVILATRVKDTATGSSCACVFVLLVFQAYVNNVCFHFSWKTPAIMTLARR